jgi:peptidoglycan/LPS O-acetylase OafA/YrhL
MGFFRFCLALAVLLFHSGLGGGAGPFAVFMFYILSGFVITRVLDVRYVHYKYFVLSFYISRIIKLLPVYLVTCFFTMVISLYISQSDAFQGVASTGAFIKTGYHDFVELLLRNTIPTLFFEISPILIFFSGFTLVPQYWTIGVEALFYVLAPLIFYFALSKSSKIYAALFIVFLIYYTYSCFLTYVNYQEFLSANYRNAFTSLFFFWWGGILYFYTKKYSFRFNSLVSAAVGLVFLVLILASAHIPLSGQPSVDFIIWQISICTFAIPILLSAPSHPKLKKWNEQLGELSYPIYVIHFMVVASVVYLLSWLESYNSLIFSVKDREITPQWVIWLYVISLTVCAAIITNYLINRPILRFRDKFLLSQSERAR